MRAGVLQSTEATVPPETSEARPSRTQSPEGGLASSATGGSGDVHPDTWGNPATRQAAPTFRGQRDVAQCGAGRLAAEARSGP